MQSTASLMLFQSHSNILNAMDKERSSWFSHWRDISDYFLPRRYPWLMTQREVRTPDRRNRKLLDSTSTLAVRTLASGMMNGITSPARPWFRLRIAGHDPETQSVEASLYLEQVTKVMYLVLAESNFYNAMALMYLEWCTFGTASMGIYEDFEEVIRCYNYALGEFYITQDDAQRLNRHGRRFERTVEQLESKFGYENLSLNVQMSLNKGGASLLRPVEIAHIVELNNPKDSLVPGIAKYREVYWEVGNNENKYLGTYPVYEWPNVTPRWETLGNDTYGTSPAMDALSDVKQLQNILLERAQALAKQVRPPLVVDNQLMNRPKALSAGGITYASASNTNFGAKVAYAVNVPYQELAFDVQQLQQRIRETCHNNLFNMISQLDTVRSATEIDARREEKLVHLGPVLERFYNEGLDPALKRVFGICERAGLFPEAPPELDGESVEVQYVSILSDAQRAVSTANVERFLQFTGQLSGVYPEVRAIPNVEEMVRDYAEGIGIKPSNMNTREQAAAMIEAEAESRAMAESAAMGKDLAAGAKVLSDTDVGGGANALQALLGG